MARIRMLKVKGKVNGTKPKVVYIHNDNFSGYTTRKRGKYNVVTIGNQKETFLNNQIRAYSAKIRFHA